MGDISKLNVGGTLYDIKDAKARTDVSDLKEDFTPKIFSIDNGIGLPSSFTPIMETGSISSSGNDEVAPTVIRSIGYIDLDAVGGLSLTMTTGYNSIVYYYDDNKSFVVRLYSSNGVLKCERRYGKYCRIVIYSSSIPTYPIPDYKTPNNYVSIFANRLQNYIDFNGLETLLKRFESIENYIGMNGQIIVEMEQGSITSQGVNEPSVTGIRTINRIDLTGLEKLFVYINTGYSASAVCYDENGNFTRIVNSYNNVITLLPSDVSARIVVFRLYDNEYPDFRRPEKYITVYAERNETNVLSSYLVEDGAEY